MTKFAIDREKEFTFLRVSGFLRGTGGPGKRGSVLLIKNWVGKDMFLDLDDVTAGDDGRVDLTWRAGHETPEGEEDFVPEDLDLGFCVPISRMGRPPEEGDVAQLAQFVEEYTGSPVGESGERAIRDFLSTVNEKEREIRKEHYEKGAIALEFPGDPDKLLAFAEHVRENGTSPPLKGAAGAHTRIEEIREGGLSGYRVSMELGPVSARCRVAAEEWARMQHLRLKLELTVNGSFHQHGVNFEDEVLSMGPSRSVADYIGGVSKNNGQSVPEQATREYEEILLEAVKNLAALCEIRHYLRFLSPEELRDSVLLSVLRT